MITDTLNNIKGNFCSRVEGVKKLSVLENLIIDQTISILEQRQQNLKNTGIENAQLLGESSLLSLRNIRTNESLSPAYELLNNQCIVLLISYFSSTMHDIFNAGVTFILRKNQFPKLPSTELKLTLKELHELDFNLQQEIGSIISKKSDISFQDMKSIHKAFGDYLSIEIERDRNVNNIIVAQACRHAIAHNGEIVDSKLIYQIRDSNPRDIQSALVEGNKIKFSPEEVDIVADEMKTYIDKLLIKIFDKHSF